jgi:hypothetical protein
MLGMPIRAQTLTIITPLHPQHTRIPSMLVHACTDAHGAPEWPQSMFLLPCTHADAVACACMRADCGLTLEPSRVWEMMHSAGLACRSAPDHYACSTCPCIVTCGWNLRKKHHCLCRKCVA